MYVNAINKDQSESPESSMQNLGFGLNFGLFGVDSSHGVDNDGKVVFDRSVSVFTEANPVIIPLFFRLAGRETGSFGILNSVLILSFSVFTTGLTLPVSERLWCDPADFRFSSFFLFFDPDNFDFSVMRASGSAGDLVNVNIPSSSVVVLPVVLLPPILLVGRLVFDLTTEG